MYSDMIAMTCAPSDGAEWKTRSADVAVGFFFHWLRESKNAAVQLQTGIRVDPDHRLAVEIGSRSHGSGPLFRVRVQNSEEAPECVDDLLLLLASWGPCA